MITANCVFCKLIAKSIPAKIVFEDADILAFHDINPKADVHLLLIPKRHITSMLDLEPTDQTLIGKMMVMANVLAKQHGLIAGYKIHVNTGIKGGQEVFHLHIHVFGNIA